MAEELIVNLEDNSYSIHIDENILANIGKNLFDSGFPKRVALVCNYAVDQLYGDLVRASLKEQGFEYITVHIGEGEEIKTLETVEGICCKLLEHGFDRSTGLIALGGGITGDVCGFTAAIFMRGIPFVQIPTTLLAQVDSSVGGKTGVNHALGKNLIGSFYQPKAVFIDVKTLSTLPDREYVAGIAEVIKYGVISDSEFFDWIVASAESIKAKDTATLIHMIKQSCRSKAAVVAKDEKEGYLRAILNYGHTFGHAVESLSNYEILHGEAVGVGMAIAAAISQAKGRCSQTDVDSILSLMHTFGISTDIPPFSQSDYITQVRRDKKVRSGKIRMVLNVGVGDCEIVEIDDVQALLSDTFDDKMQLKQPSVSVQSVPAGGDEATDDFSAIAAYTERLENNAADPVCIDIARIYVKKGMNDESMAVLQRAVEADESLADAHLLLGKLYEKNGEKERAGAAFKSAVDFGHDGDVKLLRRVVQYLSSTGEREGCRQYLARIVELDSADARAQKLLQSLPEPVESSTEDQAEGKKSAINTATIADIYVKQGLYQEALNVYTGILEDDPDNVEIKQKAAEMNRLIEGGEEPAEEIAVAETGAEESSVANNIEAESQILTNSSSSLDSATGLSTSSETGDSVVDQFEGWLRAIAMRRSHV